MSIDLGGKLWSIFGNARYLLARGDRGYVLVDRHGSVYSLAGQLKMKLDRVNEFMAPIDLWDLPTVKAAKNQQYQISRQDGVPGVEDSKAGTKP